MAGNGPSRPLPALAIGGASVVVTMRDRLGIEAGGESVPAEGPRAGESDAPGDASRYHPEAVVGEGAFGRVVRVFDRDLRRDLAVKLLKPRPGFAREDVTRFIEEAQAAAQLEHPNIIPVYELGIAGDDELYYTMKLLEGQTLDRVLDRIRRRDPEAVERFGLTRLVQVFLQVCQAVDFAHSRGVLHRDLKPHNIMLGEYGEVIVMDWGLAKVAKGGPVHTDSFAVQTMEGAIVGSPAYMSPEQASGEHERVSEASDIWSLGVILYEMLTLTLPFAAASAAWMLARILMAAPVPPRQQAPERDIPIDLERTCLQALSKEPPERQKSARELRGQVQAWLEGERERGRRSALADAKAAEGMKQLAAYRALQQDISRLEQEIAELRVRFRTWQPREEKRELFARVSELEATMRQLDRLFGDTVGLFTTAVGFAPDNRNARAALAEVYWEKFVASELADDERGMAYFRPLVEVYHDGRYARELKGDGALTLESDPPGAEAWLYSFVEEDLCLVARRSERIGTTPVEDLSLAMGNYLVVLKRQGYRDVLYPVFIARNRRWSGTVRLRSDEEIGAGFVLVPAGPFIWGGGEDSAGWELPRAETWVDDFLVAEHPVTVAEYLEFVNDLAGREREEAVRRSPRRYVKGGSFLVVTPDGRFTLPAVDDEGDVWDPRWPVVGVSCYDAMAYAEWRSQRDGRTYRLLNEAEWEKAARGVDGRLFPWGNRWDSSLCNMKESRRDQTGPVPIDGFPTDVSAYGVRGLGGNVSDWTASEETRRQTTTTRVYGVIRGGSWNFAQANSRCSFRTLVSPTLVDSRIGFRLAASVPKRG